MKLPYNHFHFVFISGILVILSYNNSIFYLLLALYFLCVLKHKEISKVSFIVCLFVYLSLNLNNNYVVLDNKIEATILEKSETEYKYKLVCRYNLAKIIVYVDKGNLVNIGDVCIFNGYMGKYDNTSDFNYSFSYKDYFSNMYIKAIYFAEDVTVINHRFTISNINNIVVLYLKDKLNGQTLNYVLSLVVGFDNFSDDQNEVYSNIGVLHLFCISGMHLNFIIGVISFILSKTNFDEVYKEFIKVLFCLCFLVITNFQISILRATLMLLISSIFIYKSINISKLDVFCITGILMIMLRPNYIFLTSFQLTFLVTFGLLLCEEIYNRNNLIKGVLLQTIIAYFISLPILLNINFEFNLLNILSVSILSLPFTYIILPLTFLIGVIPLDCFEVIYVAFENIMIKFSTLNFFIYKVGSLSFISICIYYCLYYLILRCVYINEKNNCLNLISMCFILVILNRCNLNYTTTVSFFSVGQGDSSLISLDNNKANILIDCFGNVVNLVKSRGITTLDMVIITHGHNDHMGELNNVLDNFNVKDVVCSKYDKLSKNLGCTKFVSAGDVLLVDKLVLEVVSPSIDYNDANSNSIVFKTNIYGYTFLFTGDTTSTAENDMLRFDLNSTVLKVPHHGSDTSSSLEFINSVSPKYAIFSYGVNNKYNLPNYEIINRYSNSKNYYTTSSGTIEFRYLRKWSLHTSFKK